MRLKDSEIKPINGYILVEKKIDEDKDSGLILPETAKEKAGILELIVVDVTEGEKDIAVGDIIKMMSLTKMGVFKYKDEEIMMIHRDEVGCVIRENMFVPEEFNETP